MKVEKTARLADREAFHEMYKAQNDVLEALDRNNLNGAEVANILLNLFVNLAVVNCVSRENLLAAVGTVYDARLQDETQNSTFN